MMPAMLSPGSIAALSLGLPRVASAQADPLQRVRSVAGSSVQPNPPSAAAATAPATRDAPSTPNRILPRGSLLDLSV